MIDFSSLTMTEIIRLQNQLQQELTRRFERPMALVFSDIVGSTPYFASFGDAAGRQLQQLHVDLLAACVAGHGGRIVDTVGDGAFLVFPSVAAAVAGVIDFQRETARANESRSHQHQLQVRVGIHWGLVLTDGQAVSGEAVNLCSRVAATTDAGEVRLTRAVFHELEREQRLNCRTLGEVLLKGIDRPAELLSLEWLDPALFPRSLVIEETGEHISLPRQDIVTFGRLPTQNNGPANDIVLSHPEPAQLRKISRWHFEVRRTDNGLSLLALSDSLTQVDGTPVERGARVPVRAGTRIGVAGVLTLRLLSAKGQVSDVEANSTMMETRQSFQIVAPTDPTPRG